MWDSSADAQGRCLRKGLVCKVDNSPHFPNVLNLILRKNKNKLAEHKKKFT